MFMVDPINITTVVDLTNVFGATVQTIVNKINLFVGGIFGIYLIMVFLRWWEYRALTTLLNEIKYEIVKLNAGLLGKSTKPKTTETYFSRGYKPIKQKLDGSDKKLYKKQKSNFENKR